MRVQCRRGGACHQRGARAHDAPALPVSSRAGRSNTFWNLYSTTKPTLALPTCDYGPFLNFVGSYSGNQVWHRFAPAKQHAPPHTHNPHLHLTC